MLCCMFKSNRSLQVRRLWKLRVHNEARGTPERETTPHNQRESTHCQREMTRNQREANSKNSRECTHNSRESTHHNQRECTQNPQRESTKNQMETSPCQRETNSQNQRESTQNQRETTTQNPDEIEFKSIVHAMLKRLKEKQLCTLIESIEMKGGEETECVLYPRSETRIGKKTLTPVMVCCRMWRWAGVTEATELKRMPCCASAGDTAYECVNPYHWSLLSEPETESSWLEAGRSKFAEDLDRPPDEVVSMETGMTPTPRQTDFSGGAAHWCNIAYWELRDRVGRLLPVHDPHINIFQNLPHGNGLCLQVLQGPTEFQSVRRTREKIGYGLVLSCESDGVWVYNQSDYPIFVNSPTIENPLNRTLYVHKLGTGCSLKIFDYARAHLVVDTNDPKYLDGPYDPKTIRISFAKGWGSHYSRQFLTSCPCWIEIMLNVDTTPR